MKRRWTINQKLLALTLFTLAPFAILGATWSAWILSESQEEVSHSTLNLARFAALEVDDVISQAESLLIGLAEAPPVRRLDAAGADAILSRLLPRHPFYENIVAFDAKGRMYGTGLDPRKRVWVGDRAWFQESMRSNALTVGDPILGRVRGRPVVMIAYPVRDDSGRKVGVVAAALGLLLVQNFLAEVPVPLGAVITVFEPGGRVLARTAEPEKWVLQDLSGSEIFKTMARAESGFYEGAGLDEIKRVMAFVRPKRAPWIVSVGVPSAHAYARFWRSLWALVFSVLMAGAFALLLAGLFARGLMRSFSGLVERARAVAGGQLERHGVPKGAEQEVAELFEGFDSMVDDLKAGHAEREHRYRDMAALHAIAAAITEPFNLSHLLATTLDRTVEVMEADAGMIYLLNEPADVLEIAAHRGFSEAYVRGVGRIALGEGGVGRVAVKGKPEIIEDVSTDLRVSRDVVRTEGIVSALIAPVASKRKIIGTLYVATRSPRSFTPHEVQLLVSISHQIGVAVENSRLYEAAQSQARELAALHEVSATLTTTLDFTAVLEAIADSAIKLIDAQRCAVFELDPRDQRLYPRAVRGMPPDLVVPLRLGQGAPGIAAHLRRPFYSSDVLQYPPPGFDEPSEKGGVTLREMVLQRGCRAVLAVPMVSRETVFGTIAIFWDHVHPGDERETRLLTALARQAAVAVENSSLYEAARERIREVEALLDVAAVLGSTLDLAPLLKRIARKTAQVCRVERCTIELWGEEGKVIPTMSQFADGHVDRDLWGKFRMAEPYRAEGIPAYAEMIERKAPVVIADATATDLIPREWVEVFGLKSYLLVPLIRKGRVIGAMGLDYHTEMKAFTPDQVGLATTIASQVALAVENVRLLAAERTQAGRVEVLRQIAVEMAATLELEPLLWLIIRRAVELVGVHSGTLYLLDESESALIPKAWWNLGEWMKEKVHGIGEGATGQAALTRQGVIVNDYLHWPHRRVDMLERVPITATISAPMLVQERVVGVLTLNAVEPGKVFRLADLGLLSMCAAQAAVAIENARLHGEVGATRDFLQSITEESADAIITTDLRGRFVFWSPAAESIFGYSAEEIVGRPIAGYYCGGLEEAQAIMRRLKAERRIPNYETTLRAKDGRCVEVNTSISLLRDAGGEVIGTLGIVKDITENKRLEEDLVRSERFRVLGEMAAGVAHDFNNLLAIILGHAQLLERRLADPESQERLAIIQKAVEDGVGTIRRIQEFTRLRKDRPFVTVDMNAIVKETVALTRSRWRDEADAAGVSIEVQVETGEVGTVAGNPAELREVLVNLILNALDAMPQGGCLTITTGTAPDPRTPTPEPRPTEAVVVKVADTGTGMSEEVKKRLFEPFFTTKARRGTGLGLSVAYGIVTRHGGEISVESREGEGSIFTIRLPVGEGALEEAAPMTRDGVGSLRVLVVEDEKPVRDLLVRFLTVDGHAVVGAPDGPAGIKSFTPGDFDLVITDLGMPGMSGWDVARAVKEKDPRVRVIMLTGWGDQLSPELIESSGIDRVVAKPVAFEEFMSVVSAVVRRQ